MILNKKTAIYAGVTTGFIAIAFVLTPLQLKSIFTLNTKIDDLKENISKTTADINSKQQFISDIKKIKESIASLKGEIIPSQDISTLQAYLSKQAKENNIEIVETGSGMPIVAKIINTERFLYVPISIATQCGFHSLGRFLSEIEKGKYSLKIDSLTISGSKPYHSVSIRLLALVKEEVL
ncbi:MAG: type 4a pilus biogenesis protein PilO [Candidatus Omnitrophica bacterium]|nr:type 4a pilus biogenesis protein PilO [Candidatus Omnitrophota bacterium]